MTQPILTFDTLEPDRPTISIDGVEHPLALPDDLGLLEQGQLLALMRRTVEAQKDADGLADDAALDAKGVAALNALLDEALSLIFRPSLPDDVVARMNSSHKIACITAFGEAVPTLTTQTTPQTPSDPPSTSANSSPNSRRRSRAKTGTACPSAT